MFIAIICDLDLLFPNIYLPYFVRKMGNSLSLNYQQFLGNEKASLPISSRGSRDSFKTQKTTACKYRPKKPRSEVSSTVGIYNVDESGVNYSTRCPFLEAIWDH